MTYRTIVADPPWPLRWSSGAVRRNGRGKVYIQEAKQRLPYDVMSIERIANMPVASIAEANAHLYLWAPDRFVIDGSAAQVARAWGFMPLRFLVWHKTGYGLGTFPRPQHELLLICRRGSLPFLTRDVGSVQRWKLPYARSKGVGARVHSAKPEGAYALIERASPGPYVDLFGRRPRLGWDIWGDEAVNGVELAL